LKCVEEFECGVLAADDIEREGGARAGALPREQRTGGGGFFVVSKLMDLRHFGVVTQVIRHEQCVSVRFSMRMLSVWHV
jgi:hypothetical protein